MKSLIIIPARAGSKGIPGKNWKLLAGKPLIAYTIEIALELFKHDEICISTDSKEVLQIAKNYNLSPPFVRPAELSTDTASGQDVIKHAVKYWSDNYYKPERVVVLQPTSPFRKKEYIVDALDMFNSIEMEMLVSVKETDSNPYYVLYEEDKNGFLYKSKEASFTRRQDCPKVWELNGSIYIMNVDSVLQGEISSFQKVVKYIMPREYSIDLDNELDWLFAEFLMTKINISLL